MSYKIDYENSKNQLEEWDDPFVDKSFVSDLDQATFPEVRLIILSHEILNLLQVTY